ncbi:MAG: chalcone synthase [Phycisphaerales bacterium]|nr:MAG: chalcone synthase [Phycisphaerales bacterium]
MSARLLSIGTAVPDQSMAQRDVAEMVSRLAQMPASRSRALAHLFEHAGVQRRAMAILQGDRLGLYEGPGVPPVDARMEAFHRLAPPLALQACRRALERAGVAPGRITHLVTASCTGAGSPGVDVALIRGLGLGTGTQRIHVGFMGCHAALNALRAARALALAEAGSCVLVCCVELCSLHVQALQPRGSAVADALFADGAAACVVAQSDGDAPALARSASVLLPDSLGDMGWAITPMGFAMTLSPRVPEVLAGHVRPWLVGVLAESGLALERVGAWAIHPGGPRVLDAVGQALGLQVQALQASSEVLRTHGNMSSATVLFIVQRLLEGSAGLPMLALAFGPGLTGEALLLGYEP